MFVSSRYNQASSSRTKSETKKSVVNATSSNNDMMTLLLGIMKRMGDNFAKQTKTFQQQNQSMQNKIFLLERQAQKDIFQPRGGSGWDKS